MTYTIQQATLSRGITTVLDGVTLVLPRNRVIGLIGPNGSGKTTLLASLAGEKVVARGTISIDQDILADLSEAKLASRRAVMLSHNAIPFEMTVRQLVDIGLYSFPYWPDHAREQLVELVANVVGLSKYLDTPLLARSDGEQQRAHFARALVQTRASVQEQGKAWLLLDEPTANLDPLQQQSVMKICHDLSREQDVGIVVAIHDLTLARQWCDDVVMLGQQRVLCMGPACQELNPTNLRQMYGDSLAIHVVDEPVPGILIGSAAKLC